MKSAPFSQELALSDWLGFSTTDEMKNQHQHQPVIRLSELSPEKRDLLKLAKEKTDELLRDLKKSLRLREEQNR